MSANRLLHFRDFRRESGKMSQRAITSFFTKGPPPVKSSPKISPKKDGNACDSKDASSSSDTDSPKKVTKVTGKRRWNRLQSDSEDSNEALSKSPASPEKRASKRLKNGDSPKKEVHSPKTNGNSSDKTVVEHKTNGTSSKINEKTKKLRKVGNIDLLGGNSLHPGIEKIISELQNQDRVEQSLKFNKNESKTEALNSESSNTAESFCEMISESKTCPVENVIDLKCNVEGVEEKKPASPKKKVPEETASSLDDSAVADVDDNIDESENEEKSAESGSEDVKEPSPAKKEVSSFFAPRKATAAAAKSQKKSPKEKKNAKNTKTEEKEKEKESRPESGDRQLDYDPTKKNYHPINDACWNRSDKVPYMALARTLEEIEAISARLKIVEILSNYLRSVIVLSPEDLLPSIYLCLNQLAPAYEGLELGVAETGLMKAIAQSTGRSMAQVKADAKATGDLGIVAEQSKSTQRMMFQPARLTVKLVFEKLKEIAQMSGQASMAKKVDKIQSMFVACRNSEARYLIRSLAGKLRIGLAEQSVLQAIAQACAMTPPNQSFPPEVLNAAKGLSDEKFKALVEKAALIIKTTYCECPSYNKIVPVLLQEGVEALPNHCRLTPSIPLKPMLAHPTKGVQEVLQRFDGLKFTCEFKYDGERAQIHLGEDKAVSIYSRNQENNTSKYPDVIGRLSKAVGPNVTSCILDCEAVAWDKEKKQILPFQVLSTRKRKDANEADIKVAVCVFMFDLLYLNGKPLVRETLMERRQLLKDNFIETEGEFIFATSIDTSVMDEVQDFLEVAIKGNCEGLMVKTLESEATYEIAKRSRNWLKLKKDYLEGCGDTLDVVVLGGYLGRGKRTGTYGGFLLACYDPDNEEYQSLCKIGTGFSDESLAQHSEFFKPHVIPSARPYYRYDSSHEPDHWFDAVQVWEIKCADLSLSPVHKAAYGIVDNDKGISLRFPRFLRVRDDKSVEDATSAAQVAEFYNSQDQVKNQQGTTKATEEDFY